MIATLNDFNSLIGVTAFNSLVIVLCAVTLCFVVPLLLVTAGANAVGTGAAALGRRWDHRRGRHYGARVYTSAKRSRLQ